MREYLIKRIIVSIIILWIIASLNFVIFQIVSPVSPENTFISPRFTPAMRSRLKQLYGLAELREGFLNVSSLGTESPGWTRVGTSPYLQKEDDGNYIHSKTKDETVDFDFENITEGKLVGDIDLRIRCYQTGNNETLEVWFSLDGNRSRVGTIKPDKSYAYKEIKLPPLNFSTLEKLNDAKFHLKHLHNSEETNEVYVDSAYLEFPYEVLTPIYLRYTLYIKNMFTWNFGDSFDSMKPVAEELSYRLPSTVLLLGSALVGTILVGIPMGILAASRRGSKLDVAVIGGGLFTWGVPTFFIQLLFILFFSYYAFVWFGFQIFPAGGIVGSPAPKEPLAYIADVAYHLAQPLITLIVAGFGSWALYTRNILLDSLTQDYVVTARAKGLSERTVLYRHAFRATLPPVVTMIALNVPGIIGGAMITEYLFSLPGIGQWYLKAVLGSDYPVVQANLFIYAVLMIIANFVADLMYGVLDPRIRVGVRR